MTTYPRDRAGYGATPPDARWPRGARLALQIVVNFEEGPEYTILDGDGRTEVGLAEAPGAADDDVPRRFQLPASGPGLDTWTPPSAESPHRRRLEVATALCITRPARAQE